MNRLLKFFGLALYSDLERVRREYSTALYESSAELKNMRSKYLLRHCGDSRKIAELTAQLAEVQRAGHHESIWAVAK